MPNVGQLILVGLGLAFLLAATGMAVVRARRGSSVSGWSMRLLLVAALTANAGVLMWRWSEQGFVPPRHNFDSTILFTTLASLVVLLVSLSGRLKSLELFFLPVIAIFQAGAYLTCRMPESEFPYRPWFNLHALAMIAGSIFFSVGCAGAGMYLVAARRLRRKQVARVLGRLPSLETSEKLSWYGVCGGFALLTFGILSGLCEVYRDAHPLQWIMEPKVLLTFVVWLLYLVVLLVRLAPRFRGRRAALMTISSFVLLTFVFVITDLFSKKHP